MSKTIYNRQILLFCSKQNLVVFTAIFDNLSDIVNWEQAILWNKGEFQRKSFNICTWQLAYYWETTCCWRWRDIAHHMLGVTILPWTGGSSELNFPLECVIWPAVVVKDLHSIFFKIYFLVVICWNPELDIFSSVTSFKYRLTIDATCRSRMTSNVLEIPTPQVGKSSPQLCKVVASHVAYMFGDIYEEFRLIEEEKYKTTCDSIESTSSNQINGTAWSFTNRRKKLNRIYSIHVSLTTRGKWTL